MDEYLGNKHIIATQWECGTRQVGEFSPKAPWELNGDKLLEKFKESFLLIRDEELQDWTRKFVFYWEKNGFPTGGDGADILNATAGISIHHAYQHGWLEHVWEVISLSAKHRELYEGNGIISKKEGDLLIVGAFVHRLSPAGRYRLPRFSSLTAWSAARAVSAI